MRRFRADFQRGQSKDFPQKEELELARENHASVIRELQHMQDDASYVSHWSPKTATNVDKPTDTSVTQEDTTPEAAQETLHKTLKFGEGETHTEYTV